MNRRYIYVALTISALVYGAFVLNDRWRQPNWDSLAALDLHNLKFDAYDLYDLGVASIDSDNKLDIFTVNHSAQQVFVSGDSPPTQMYEFGLGQDAIFPGVEAAKKIELKKEPGVYIYRKEKYLNVEVVGNLPVSFPIVINLELPWPWEVVSSTNSDVKFGQREEESPEGNNVTWHRASLSLKKEGKVVLVGQQDILELPHVLTVEPESILPFIRIGNMFSTPIEKRFQLIWRDRHSMAWHDINNDGVLDVFIGRGGVKGQLANVGVTIHDELLIRSKNSVIDIAALSGLKKGDCPGRQSAWVDINGDGVLDLHASCGRAADGSFPDQLYIHNGTNGFVDRGAELGLANEGVSTFRWLDVELDGDSDQLLFDGSDLVLNVNENGRFSKTILRKSLNSKPTQIAVADIDGDLDLDAFVVMRKNSVILLNQEGRFEVTKPESLGLPSALRAISFVDTDLDGKLDAHVVPGGLYKGAQDKYERSSVLEDNTRLALLSSARCVWYDKDINGQMDVVCAFERFPPKEVRIWKKLINKIKHTRYWTLHSGEFIGTEGNNWLQFDLIGDDGNREALGAFVTVRTKSSEQRQYVGQFETSHFSQGHYRLYFGLGENTDVESVTVHWPDSTTQEVQVNTPNQLLTIRKPAGVE